MGTLAGLWEAAVARHGAAGFLHFHDVDTGDTVCWTYTEFDDRVARVAGGLGIGPGDTVHLALGNCPAFVAVWLAAARVGARIVPADPRATEAELAEQIRRTRPVVGVCAAARAAPYRAAAGGTRVLELTETAADLDDGAPLVGTPRTGSAAAGDVLAIMFTSGTTAAPKGVLLTQALYAFTGETMARAARLSARHRWFVVLPLFHANAQYYCFASAIAVGASVALASRFTASGWRAQAAGLGVTHASLFAAPARMILARDPGGDPLALEHVWFAQNLTRDEYERLAALTGCRPRQLYGMTETGPAVLTDTGPEPVPDTIGTPTEGCLVRLAADPGGGLPHLEVGGQPGHTLFLGYLDDPGTTAAAFTDDGWFRTGDRATVDDDGRYRFGGRGGDIVKVGGENVSLTEVEAVLATHPAIFEVVAVGAPDPVLDETVAAVYVPAGAAPSEEELLAWSAQRLAPARRPRRFLAVDELPRTSVGKIKRFQVGQLLR
ncbi:AMP-binding protein [Pseudonocardia sp. C8]|uniref:class I adenylate-forming enzyme family protein n=1 Tax=Pseudonocardia sp. C8 TaxID=2762759 RepID=UPI0016432B1C|nr:AMP-binding protein [Pseudonocardia sp. C8]MBC3191121.1 AMP-binding protein [Pseudonocardia sp. C8]